jgi:DUF4097 and DUF4098 domain-containing protein YvlB
MRTLAIALILLATGAHAALADRPIDERRAAAPDGMVTIENLGGAVTIEGWDKKEVTITGTLAADAERLDVSGNEDRIAIEVVFPKDMKHRDDTDSDLNVRVPQGSRVRVRMVNGGINTSGVDGTLELETVNGSIVIAGDPKKIEAQTVNGSVRIESSASEVKAQSVSGDVELHGLRGEVSANTVSGDIELIGNIFDEVDCSTVSGDIHFEGTPSKTCSIDIECHSGTITLVLPEDVSAEFEVDTFSGSIVNDFGPEAHRTSKYAPGKELDFSTGSGDARISVSSFSGSVRLKTK